MKKKNKVLMIGSSILILASMMSSSTLANNPSNGNKCYGDKVCIDNKKEQMKKANHGDDKKYQSENKGNHSSDLINDIKNSPKDSLSDWEKNYLTYRLEEEKTARDVYITLAEKWNIKPFTNIKNSEQMHMDIVKALRDKYDFETEYITENKVGVFEDKKFQDLYNKLVEKGLKSELDAMKVGMMIEDIDIYDLDNSLKMTQNKDLRMVLEKFIKASSHHMQAFDKNLQNRGGSYTPEYITTERMKEALMVEKGAEHKKETTTQVNKEKEKERVINSLKKEIRRLILLIKEKIAELERNNSY